MYTKINIIFINFNIFNKFIQFNTKIFVIIFFNFLLKIQVIRILYIINK